MAIDDDAGRMDVHDSQWNCQLRGCYSGEWSGSVL
jgi:hypothetical protein